MSSNRDTSQAGAAQTPLFMNHAPTELRFGTSGLRGLVTDMTDLEVYINTRGYLDYLKQSDEVRPGAAVAIARDLRHIDPKSGLSSSPRIARAAAQAIRDAGLVVVNCGTVPTPALAHYAMLADLNAGKQPMPSVMVTGSHIPADRNGVKFYKSRGEVLKDDEPGILAAVAAMRIVEYAQDADQSLFDGQGMLKSPAPDEAVEPAAGQLYLQRYLQLFGDERPLAGLRVALYQHSAVGRDLLAELFTRLGADLVATERSDSFVPVDTEDVTDEDRARYARFVEQHRPDAIISTDGDSDRPLVVDERGRFHRGDVLGILVSDFLHARVAAVPISTSDALDLLLERRARAGEPTMLVEKTRIGSPFVIAAMNRAIARGADGVVAWEANGGYLTATSFEVNGRDLSALPTRDAVLPILAVLLQAKRRGVPLSQLFDELPFRATGAGLIDGVPPELSQAIVNGFRPADTSVEEARFDANAAVSVYCEGAATDQTLSRGDPLGADLLERRQALQRHFSVEQGFSPITRMSFIDGVRAWLQSGEIIHLRPSGNAPQLRLYVVSDSEERTSAIIEQAVGKPDGLLDQMSRELSARA